MKHLLFAAVAALCCGAAAQGGETDGLEVFVRGQSAPTLWRLDGDEWQVAPLQDGGRAGVFSSFILPIGQEGLASIDLRPGGVEWFSKHVLGAERDLKEFTVHVGPRDGGVQTFNYGFGWFELPVSDLPVGVAVPEPAGWKQVLLGIGLLALCVFVRDVWREIRAEIATLDKPAAVGAADAATAVPHYGQDDQRAG